MKETVKDQRLFERFNARFPVKFKHSRGDFGTEVFLRDASAQGAKVSSSQRLFLHDSVSLLVKLPDGVNPLALNGMVVWSKSRAPKLWDIGIEFHKVDFMGLHRLYKRVDDLE